MNRIRTVYVLAAGASIIAATSAFLSKDVFRGLAFSALTAFWGGVAWRVRSRG